jgi:hypothetical protein
MDTKLTLKLDQEVIERAKKYAADQKKSLSHVVENYLNSLTSIESKDGDLEISPFVKSMSTKLAIPIDFDHKKAMGDYREEKHK